MNETELREALLNAILAGVEHCGIPHPRHSDACHLADAKIVRAAFASIPAARIEAVLDGRVGVRLVVVPAEPEQADEVAGLDERSYQIGLRAHRRRIAELQQAISDEYDAWVAVEDAQRARLAPARDDGGAS